MDTLLPIINAIMALLRKFLELFGEDLLEG